MDTRFWGPDGWKLLHSITANYPDHPSETDKHLYSTFFNCIEYVLPCIYCRNSFKEYISKEKINLDNKRSLCEWLYNIHNLVNDKLRKQGNNDEPDPKFADIYNKYLLYVDEINNSNCINMPGWDFIYCIFFNYPIDVKELNHERIRGYAIFLLTIFKILPFKIVKNIILDCNIIKELDLEKELLSRENLKTLIYKLEKYTKDIIDCKCLPYEKKCEYIEKYRAGCSTKTKTCRNNNKKI
jgi:hypothetical protein